MGETMHTEKHDEALVEDVLKTFPRPSRISDVCVEFKEDSAGSPAVYLSFKLDEGTMLTDDEIAGLSDYMMTLQDQLLRNGISRFPYAALVEAA